MRERVLSKNIDDIFLLNSPQWLNAVSSVPNIPVETDNPWWLSEKGPNDITALRVYTDGTIDEIFGHIRTLSGIRPCFRLKISNGTVVPGDKVTVGNLICTVIKRIVSDEIYCDALSDRVVTFRTFGMTNKYFESEIYKYIHSDDFRMICGLERDGSE